MPVIYLKHPKHGRKVAIAEEEAVADEKNGWERFKLGDQPVNELPKRVRKVLTLPEAA